MIDQSKAWSRIAGRYEEEFVDPYRPGATNPLLDALVAVPHTQSKTAVDLGCGIGPLLPILARHFQHVIGVDFAEGMLARARQRCLGRDNVELLQGRLTDLATLHGRAEVALAVNSLVQPSVGDIERVLEEVRRVLRPGGWFFGIVPAMDAVHYHTMLLLDRARETGMPEERARKNAAQHAEHKYYDFDFQDFSYEGIRQHFWLPFEIDYRLTRAGFVNVSKAEVRLDWEQFACAVDLKQYPAPWDWFFACRTPNAKQDEPRVV